MKADKPLGRKAYGHIPHLPGSRMGPGDHHCHEGQARMCCEKRRDKRDLITVQEKLDGSCCSVARVGDSIVALVRAGYLATSSPHAQHHIFDLWVASRAGEFRRLLNDGERACGEWLAMAHGTKYDMPHEPFVIFDVMVADRRIYTADLLAKSAAILGFTTPRVLHVGDVLPIDAAMALAEPSGHGALDPVEGAVWRVERDGAPDFIAKFVRHDKQDGSYFSDTAHVWNKWPGCEQWLPAQFA